MRKSSFSRSLATLCGAALLAALVAGLNGCGGSPNANSKNLTVGFVYIGSKDDYGYSQAHAQGAAAVRKMPDVTCLEVEKVPETDAVQQTMKSMIEVEGAKMVFASSYGYFKPHVLEVAKKYPEIYFMHCGGPWKQGDPTNIYSYFGYIDECQYLSGIVAGKTTKTNKLGFVAAKPIPQVRRNINAFLLGARSVNPKAEVHVIFTGDWSLPTEEANATTNLIRKDVDVITCHVDSPKVVIETAEKAGKFTCGYHASQADLAPKGYLTGAEWNWEKVYVDFVNKVKKGEKMDNYVRGGLNAGIVKMSPYGAPVSEETKQAADSIKAQFMSGSFKIFKGPLQDNEGKEVIAAGKEFDQNNPALEGMDYLVDGVISAK